jgi:hypothetical protein
VNNDSLFITVVSGLPRSGTSLMMQMLAAGGMPLVTDGVRESDADNLKGYFEFELVKRTKADSSWVATALGKAVKVIYLLIADLPREYSYRVIFMRRELREMIASQQTMLVRRGESGAALDSDKMTGVFERQLAKVDAWLAAQPNFRVLSINYREVIDDPQTQAERVRDFLSADLDVAAMCAVVDPRLYRQRSVGLTS